MDHEAMRLFIIWIKVFPWSISDILLILISIAFDDYAEIPPREFPDFEAPYCLMWVIITKKMTSRH